MRALSSPVGAVHAASAADAAALARLLPTTWRRLVIALLPPVALYAFALVIRLWSAGHAGFPASEGSAYYVGVARSLVEGRGLTIDAVWSYATPPLVLPRPAFELWQPLASFIAAAPMAVLGTSYGAAQIGGLLVGALLAPLGWLIAREAAAALGEPVARSRLLALGAGAVVALVGPLLVATALPDSTVPFAVAATVWALLLSRAVSAAPGARATTGWGLLTGGALGVAWLARHEAVWLGAITLAFVLVGHQGRGWMRVRLVGAIATGGALMAAPWLLRNVLVFGTALPGQALDNALLTSNEQIFGYLGRPTAEAFLGQGAGTIAANLLTGALHNIVDVLLVPAAPVVVIGVLSIAGLWRHRAAQRSALSTLLAGGMLVLGATTLLFPVASRWGTFEHAAGPLLVGLAVAAVLGLDRAIAIVGRRRKWRNSNAWLAPLTLAAAMLPLAAVALAGVADQAAEQGERYAGLGRVVLLQPAAADRRPIISDRPLWLADATGLPTLALPAEPLSSLLRLANDFDARLVVLGSTRGDYPALLRTIDGQRCFEENPPMPGQPPGSAVFVLRPECDR